MARGAAGGFGSAPLAARRLIRQRQRIHDLQKLDQQLLGLLKTREAILRVDPTGRDLSIALRDAGRALERELARRGEDFGQAARTRRRDRGLPVVPTGKVLPFRPRREDVELEAERMQVRELEEAIERSPGWSDVGGATGGREGRGPADAEKGPGAEGGGGQGRIRTGAWLRWRSAETRMRHAFAALEAAEAERRSPRELERLAAAFERASGACAAAEAVLARLDDGARRPGEFSARAGSDRRTET